MKIQQLELIDFKRNQFENFYFNINDTIRNAKKIYFNLDISAVIGKKYLILSIDNHHFVIASDPFIKGQNICYSHPHELLTVQYRTGNLAIFAQKITKSNKPILYYDQSNQTIEFHQNQFDFPIQKLPAQYQIKSIGKDYISITRLLSRPGFAKFCNISLDTMRNWTESGKLIPYYKSARGSMFFSKNQISEVTEIVEKRLNKDSCIRKILDSIAEFHAGQILQLNFFKMQIQNYRFANYATLRRTLKDLITKGFLERVRNGYYKILK